MPSRSSRSPGTSWSRPEARRSRALAVFFNFLPIVLSAFFGGVIVDRLGFRTTSVLADLASAAAVAAIPLLDLTVGIELWQLFALVFLGALLDAPGATARAALLPDVVELAGVRMERASGIRSSIQQGSTLVGAPIGGVLVAAFGATTALWLDAASFLVSAALIVVFVPRPHESEATGEPAAASSHELADGMRFIWNQRLLRALVLTVLVTNLLEAPLPIVLGRLRARGVRQRGRSRAHVRRARRRGSRRRARLQRNRPPAPAATHVRDLLRPRAGAVPRARDASATSGRARRARRRRLAAGPINPLVFTVLTEVVPKDLRGRVFGAVRAGAWASIPLGVLLGGVIVGTFGVAATFLAIGVLYSLVVAYGFFNPAFRAMDRAAET